MWCRLPCFQDCKVTEVGDEVDFFSGKEEIHEKGKYIVITILPFYWGFELDNGVRKSIWLGFFSLRKIIIIRVPKLSIW